MSLNLRSLIPTSIFLTVVASETLAFPDIQNHWAHECISQMQPRNLATGYPDGNFRPQGSITRAEFAVLMLNAFPDAPIIRNGITFKDVPANHWAKQAIQDAYRRGFFTGYPGNIFQPNQAIPRVQAIAILAGAKNYKIQSLLGNANQNPLQQYYDDADQIPNYARAAVTAASTNLLVVNYPQIRQLRPNQSATRGEVAALFCRALNIYALPGEYIAGVDVHPQQVRSLPGKIDQTPVFNSNSPELVRQGGILLSTFPPTGKATGEAHLNYAFNGRFDIFSHHLARAETTSQINPPFYQGIILHNPTSRTVTVEILQAASYLSNPDAPFIPLPDILDNADSTVYSGPGSRVMGEVLRGIRQENFPETIAIAPASSHILLNQPLPIKRIPASNGRSTMIRLRSDGGVYVANLAMRTPNLVNGIYRPPTKEDWVRMLIQGDFAQPRDSIPTPLDPPRQPTVFGRVAGVSQGGMWEARITEHSNSNSLNIPAPGEAISYVLGTLHLITLNTEQIQSAPMLRRYADTAYFAHSNYGVEYKLTLPLTNRTNQVQRVEVLLQTPLKDEGGEDKLLFANPSFEQVFFRGTVRVNDGEATRYLHLVQRRGELGKPLLNLTLQPGELREIKVDFIYPPDVTPPQVLTVRAVDLLQNSSNK